MSIFPEIVKFEQLVREILQAPQQVLPASFAHHPFMGT